MNSQKQFTSKDLVFKDVLLGLFRTKLLTKTRLWRGFVVRLPEGSQEPTRQLVAVLVDSDLHYANSCFDAFGPKDGGSRILYYSPIREILCGV